MIGQIELTDYLKDFEKEYYGVSVTGWGGCSKCICETCLYRWQGRCPKGTCFDDLRAREYPYDKMHPNEKPRTAWSRWNEPGEQAHWCRGGTVYCATKCDSYVKYEGSIIRECLVAPVQVFQDGYIRCSLVDSIGCTECMRRFEERQEREEEQWQT